jgi:hypothetical protein
MRILREAGSAKMRHTWGERWRPFARSPLTMLASIVLLVAALLYNIDRVSLAVQVWLPGDALYPAKIAFERLDLLASLSPEKQARLHIEFASRRLTEIQALVFDGRYESIPPTVLDFGDHVAHAVTSIRAVTQKDPAQARLLAMQLQQALDQQTAVLHLLAGVAPLASKPQFERVIYITESGLWDVQPLISPSRDPSGAANKTQPLRRRLWVLFQARSLHLTDLFGRPLWA